MSKEKQSEAGNSEGARRATGEASASHALVGTGRWSARRKVSVVINREPLLPPASAVIKSDRAGR